MQSAAATIINKKKVPNDKYFTPESLAKFHVEYFYKLVNNNVKDTYEPFAGEGVYIPFLNAISNRVFQTELDDGTDFFQFDMETNNTDCDSLSIITNPPYSKITPILKRIVEERYMHVSLLIGTMNLTPSRLQFMEKNGYRLIGMHFTRVRGWFSFSVIVTWTKSYFGEESEHMAKITSDVCWHIQDDTNIPVSKTE